MAGPMTTEPTRLVGLVHHRWTLPALAVLGGAEDPAKRFASLRRRLGASRGGLDSALAVLEDRGWIESRPEHGHPLRPEFHLTEGGRGAAVAAGPLHDTVTELELEEIAYRKWSLPVLAAAGDEGARFSVIGSRLPDSTDRALSAALELLEEHDLLERRVRSDERPPVVVYRPTERGRLLRRRLEPLLDRLEPDAPSG